MTSVLTFYKSTRQLSDKEKSTLSACIAGVCTAKYELRDQLLEDGTLDIIEIETEDDESTIIKIFENSGYFIWGFCMNGIKL